MFKYTKFDRAPSDYEIITASYEASMFYKVIQAVDGEPDGVKDQVFKGIKHLGTLTVITLLDRVRKDLDDINMKGYEGLSMTTIDKLHAILSASLLDSDTLVPCSDDDEDSPSYVKEGGIPIESFNNNTDNETSESTVIKPAERSILDDQTDSEEGEERYFRNDGYVNTREDNPTSEEASEYLPGMEIDTETADASTYSAMKVDTETTEASTYSAMKVDSEAELTDTTGKSLVTKTDSSTDYTTEETPQITDSEESGTTTSQSVNTWGSDSWFDRIPRGIAVIDAAVVHAAVAKSAVADSTDADSTVADSEESGTTTQSVNTWGSDSWLDRRPRGSVSYIVPASEEAEMTIDLNNNPLHSDSDTD
jgi:hypothetical protein